MYFHNLLGCFSYTQSIYKATNPQEHIMSLELVTNCCYNCFHRSCLKDGRISKCHFTIVLYRNWKLERLHWKGQQLLQMRRPQSGEKWLSFPSCQVKKVGGRKSVMTQDQSVYKNFALEVLSRHNILFTNWTTKKEEQDKACKATDSSTTPWTNIDMC